VVPTLRERYFDDARMESVQARFAQYRNYGPSYCRQILVRHFDEKETNPQRAQFNAAFGLPVGFRVARTTGR
jgi:hypothetical protein